MIVSTQALLLDRERAKASERAVSAGLTEEQLAVCDLLTRAGPELTVDEEHQVKSVVEQVLAALKRKKLVLDCRKEQRTRAALRVTVEEDAGPAPGEVHPTDLCPEVRRRVPARVLFESYFDDGDSVYDRVA